MSSSSPKPVAQDSSPESADGDHADASGHEPSASQIGVSNAIFYLLFIVMGGTYVVLIVSMLAADAAYMTEKTFDGVTSEGRSLLSIFSHNPITTALADRRIQHSI